MSELAPYGTEYRAEDWPHGLRCAECETLIEEGDRYASKWDSMVDDIPCCLVVCLACALPEGHVPVAPS